MRNKLLFTILICMVLVAGKSSAQDLNVDLRVGGGISYLTSDIADIGFNIRSEARFGTIGLGIDANLYSTDELYELNTANINLFYNFNPESINPYALAGANIAILTFGTFEELNVGVNLGGGIDIPLGGKLGLFAEGKYVLSSLDEVVVTGGLKFLL